MQEVTFLINLTVALTVAFLGGLIARRLGAPTILGYMMAGIAIGPFTPGFVGDFETISQLAELGVIFLMFGIGLDFSLRDLARVSSIAVPGSLTQMAVVTLLGFGLGVELGWPIAASVVVGIAIANASSVVMIRQLMDHSLLNTPHGKVSVGWSLVQDLVAVLVLVLMPALAQQGGAVDFEGLFLAAIKAGLFVGLMLFIGTRIVPWLLRLIAHTRSRELFILAALIISLGTALGSAQMFGVSLALGAFVAGVVISESPLSHQAAADLLPFREAFAVLFFVSIGMLVNPDFLFSNLGIILTLTALIVFGKPVIITAMGLIFPYSARTALVVSAGNGQIGELSFIIGQAALALGLLSRDQYSLILAGALLSITINHGAFRSLDRIESRLKLYPRLWRLLDRHGPSAAPFQETIDGHVVVVGYGRVGHHIVDVFEVMKQPVLVIESDVVRIEELNRRGTLTLFGDAANSEIISHARLERALALVITVPEETTSALIVAAARDQAPELPIIVRAATVEGVEQLAALGAQDVIHPELEGGLEIVRHTLLRLGLPLQEINRYTDMVRQDHYDLQISSEAEHKLLHNLLSAMSGIEVTWLELPPAHPIIGQTLAETNLRALTGASVIAILRRGTLMANPKSATAFEADDRIGLIGESAQIRSAEELLGVPGLRGRMAGIETGEG